MVLTDKEKRTVLAVFDELLKKPYEELNTFLGTRTIHDMSILCEKLRHEEYCERYGISYEDMTESDFIDAYMYEDRYEEFEYE